jgi:hypothetical protein
VFIASVMLGATALNLEANVRGTVALRLARVSAFVSRSAYGR